MSETSDLAAPVLDGWDHAHATVRAALATIPVAGGAATELFNALVTPPIEKRRAQWMNDVSQAIGTLYQHDAAIIERITGDEQFQSVLIQASWVAVRNHQQAKLAALKSAVLSSAQGTKVSADLQLLFVRYVDELTPSHLLVMREFVATQTAIADLESYQALMDILSPSLDDSITPTVFKLVCVDLQSRGLIRISRELNDFPGLFVQSRLVIAPDTGGPRLLVTDLGEDFVSYVTRGPEEVTQ